MSPFGRPDHRPRRGAVVRPGGEEDARGDLEILVFRDECVLAHTAGLRRQRGRRIEELIEIVRAADRGHLGPDHRGVARRPATATGELSRIAAVHVARVAVAAGLGLAAEGELAHERHRRERSRGGEQLATGQRLFSHS